MKIPHVLPRGFYLRDDVGCVARELLGKFLITNFNGKETSGIIMETEAYCGLNDRACHACNGRRSTRNEVMYGPGGRAYVYLCYGMHHLFNVVTNVAGRADAVLIRAVEPVTGVEHMLRRRHMKEPQKRLTSGPGALSQAFGIRVWHNKTDLIDGKIRIEDRGIEFSSRLIARGPRIGVSYAGKDAALPWRFWVKDNPWAG